MCKPYVSKSLITHIHKHKTKQTKFSHNYFAPIQQFLLPWQTCYRSCCKQKFLTWLSLWGKRFPKASANAPMVRCMLWRQSGGNGFSMASKAPAQGYIEKSYTKNSHTYMTHKISQNLYAYNGVDIDRQHIFLLTHMHSLQYRFTYVISHWPCRRRSFTRWFRPPRPCSSARPQEFFLLTALTIGRTGR